MTSLEFCYWLQGYMDLSGEKFTSEQMLLIQRKLAIVIKNEPLLTIGKLVSPAISYGGSPGGT